MTYCSAGGDEEESGDVSSGACKDIIRKVSPEHTLYSAHGQKAFKSANDNVRLVK